MSQEHQPERHPTIEQAVVELQHLIQEHYPETVFAVGPGGDDPAGIYLTAIVDLDDPDVVMDLVIERVLALQVEELLPIHVVPVRTPERVDALRRQLAGGHHLSTPLAPLHP